MPPSMSRAEREEFLAGLHVGVLSVARRDGRGPLTIPIWYTYQPGGTVNVSTGRGTRKAQAIAAAGRFSLCAQDERPPYKYVTVEGPAVIEDATDAERLELARRYLGTEGGDAFLAANPGGSQVMIRMTPEHWLSGPTATAEASRRKRVVRRTPPTRPWAMVLVRATTLTDWQAMREIRLQALRDAPDAFGSTYARDAAFGAAEWHRRATRDGSFFAFLPEPGSRRPGWPAATRRSRAWSSSSPCSSARRPAATASARHWSTRWPPGPGTGRQPRCTCG